MDIYRPPWERHERGKYRYTPLYKNWFQLQIDSAVKATAIRDIPPPWERQGLFDILRNEGVKRWPLIYLFRDGRLQAAGKRFMDWDGTPYIALRALPHRQEAGSSSGERAVIRWYGHEIIFARGQEQEVLVDGKRFKLKLKIKTIGGEPFIAVSEVGRLLGVRAVWMEAEDSVVLERDEQAGTEV